MSIIAIIIRWLIITVSILLASAFIPGIRIDSVLTAVIAAGLLGIINVIIRPILIILTLPLNILTLGLFSFVVNALLLKLVADFVTGFDVDGFFSALAGALVISFVNWLVNLSFVKGERGPTQHVKPDYIDLKQKDNGKWE